VAATTTTMIRQFSFLGRRRLPIVLPVKIQNHSWPRPSSHLRAILKEFLLPLELSANLEACHTRVVARSKCTCFLHSHG
jgi:hypothetical protein